MPNAHGNTEVLFAALFYLVVIPGLALDGIGLSLGVRTLASAASAKEKRLGALGIALDALFFPVVCALFSILAYLARA